jgi:hypothetical protein
MMFDEVIFCFLSIGLKIIVGHLQRNSSQKASNVHRRLKYDQIKIIILWNNTYIFSVSVPRGFEQSGRR